MNSTAIECIDESLEYYVRSEALYLKDYNTTIREGNTVMADYYFQIWCKKRGAREALQDLREALIKAGA